MIVPSIGRVVWFQPAKTVGQPLLDQNYAGMVAYVHGDRMINISYVDHAGEQHAARSVPLLQDDDTIPDTGYFCHWMPYQVKAAEKS